MRRLVAAGLCAALQVGALCAPLVHAHLDDHHAGHHAAPAVHAHFGGHGAEHHGPTASRRVHEDPAYVAHDAASVVGNEPEQATRLQIFVAVATTAVTEPALPPARFALSPAFESGMRRPPEVVRSHGPPFVRSAASRAPPASSV